jgi:TatD DNase family protein
MRGNANVARTLLDAGCYLSYGPRFNPEALKSTPMDRLLIETDDSDTPITTVASLAAQTLHLTIDEITSTATANTHRLLMNGPK